MRKVFVCCRESEKKQLLEKANKVYKGSAVLTPYVEDADVLVIVEEPDDTMQQKIKEAAGSKIQIVRVDQNLRCKDVIQKIYGNKAAIKSFVK